MKVVYPVILSENPNDKVPFYVSIPDLNTQTQGEDIVNAIEMARDAINLMIVNMEDEGKTVPSPNSKEYELEDGDKIAYVDADPDMYRKKLKGLSVKKNCTIPQWLAEAAENKGINFSRVLQEALMEKVV